MWTTQQDFKACLDAGMNAAASWFFKQPASAPAKQLNASQAQIVRVLNLVRKNAEVKEIEAALKQDVALSYKLLRYINSAGFGLSCEVQSFKHAVTILGYDKLNKWLSLLLATASKDPMAPALMHTALTRARLMEVLGTVWSTGRSTTTCSSPVPSRCSTPAARREHGAGAGVDAPAGADQRRAAGQWRALCPFLELALACEGNDGNAALNRPACSALTPSSSTARNAGTGFCRYDGSCEKSGSERSAPMVCAIFIRRDRLPVLLDCAAGKRLRRSA